MIPRSKKFAISTFLQYLIKTILYLITCSTYCFAQTGRSAVHEIPRSVIERVQTASIKMFGIDSLSGQQNSAPFSGVIVHSDGTILTVAHATRPGNFYRVIFSDGTQGIAKALGRLVVDQQSNLPDIAMMKMLGQGPWPYAEMGWSSSITENQLCFGLSYPETLPFNIPFLRTGRILKKLDNFGFIQSSSIMEPGDSGGPLFDALGRVIGLHSRIDGAEGINFEVPINSYRSYWQSLTNPVVISSYPVSTDSIGKDPQQKKLFKLGIKKPAKHPKTNFQPIQISSTLDGDSILLLGTAFNLGNNKQVILSKSSLIGEAPIVKIGNRIHVLRILLRDEKSDLAALVSDHQFPSVDVSKVARQSISDSFVGLNLWSLLGDDQRKFGVLGMSSQTFPRLPVPGTFDAQMQEIEGLPTLTKVDSMGAAARAGLRVGDRMLTLNNRDVSSAIKINAVMQQFSAGDTLQVQYRRGAADLYTNVILSNWPVRENPHPANNIPKGKSVRRDNFLRVFLHDSRIHADECGSPVVDSKGNFIGLNIARFSHTACLAIPRDTILAFLSTVEHML
ncbi:trypsin-like peptidase domain-containing protein [Sphingobacterium paramultivorum]|uniref:Trypsin-like peptidase domain-containing protein n=1 Tax=Sphingobacterium paramultivorum TaxID=2886510 RepID=A0A7G5DXF5_9SPHI|nr:MULTISPECIES: trypsin-like peptidase domain-containing protein [Sphingobacterium]MCS4163708.1 serine protease Do [Sphingobacterium sp. BIGb0116]QMV66430.1 trypsin-like peptidase domain-containing protein [Sphingobacterium paramultivorum]WSO15225.1 trypsin-like peptidase domain-containing protein [Sphingobacterium paramultivorum]